MGDFMDDGDFERSADPGALGDLLPSLDVHDSNSQSQPIRHSGSNDSDDVKDASKPPPSPSSMFPFELPLFSQAPATGKWISLIEKLLKNPPTVSSIITQAQIKQLVEDASAIFASEPTCLHIELVNASILMRDASKSSASNLNWANVSRRLSAEDAVRSSVSNGSISSLYGEAPRAPAGAVQARDDLVLVGDIHGQFADLLCSILAVQGRAKARGEGDRTFLFLGDYVDRGPQSVETILLLLALKVEYPDRIQMIRGNHEESRTCKLYGFMAECRAKLQLNSWYQFISLFNELPLAAIVYTYRGKFFCCHGGLSPGILTNPEESLAFTIRQSYGQGLGGGDDVVDGLLWSDPTANRGFNNNARGCGYVFGRDVTESFCTSNTYEMVVRAHQMVQQGYMWDHDHRLLTVFSAPRYCGINDNLGAICIVHSNARWLELDQSQPLHFDANTHQPLRVSPLAPTIGTRLCPVEALLEFVGFDTVIQDIALDDADVTGKHSPQLESVENDGAAGAPAGPSSTTTRSESPPLGVGSGAAAATASTSSSGSGGARNTLCTDVAGSPRPTAVRVSPAGGRALPTPPQGPANSPPAAGVSATATPPSTTMQKKLARPAPAPENDPMCNDYFGA